jgi:hypothetical protein
MSINRSIKKTIALVLAAGAVALAIQIAAAPVAAGASGRPARIAHSQDIANAIPPILPRESASQLKAREAWEAVVFFSDPPAGAPYSNADMNAYASASNGGS